MGSKKRHRRIESDMDSFQKVSVPGTDHEVFSFGDTPYRIKYNWGKNSNRKILNSNDFFPVDDFYINDDTWNFGHNCKA